MPERKIRTVEYWCTRCSYKWMTRKNGKESDSRPKACARCKSRLWDTPRNNDMTNFYKWRENIYGSKMSEKEREALKDKQISAITFDQMPEEFLKDWKKIEPSIVRNTSNRHKSK